MMRRRRRGAGFELPALLVLPEVTVGDGSEGEIFVEIGPRQAERGNVDVVGLGGGSSSQTRISSDRKESFHAACGANNDVPIQKGSGFARVRKGAYAASFITASLIEEERRAGDVGFREKLNKEGRGS